MAISFALSSSSILVVGSSERTWAAIESSGRVSSSSFRNCCFLFAKPQPLQFKSRAPWTRVPAGGCGRNVVCEVAVQAGSATAEVQPGQKIRVKVPLTVYHVGKAPNLDINGLEGEVKEILKVYKGKTISANFPIKTQFFIEVNEKQVKFFTHLREDEFEIVN